ncbi:hypothetical protein [Psychrosphaera aestuarii]
MIEQHYSHVVPAMFEEELSADKYSSKLRGYRIDKVKISPRKPFT